MVFALENEIEALCAENERLRKALDRGTAMQMDFALLQEALNFYAHEWESHVGTPTPSQKLLQDQGQRARTALKGKDDEQE